MKQIARHSRFIALCLGTTLTTLAPIGDAVLHAADVDVSRARIETATLTMPEAPSRACWARYSTNGAAGKNGVIEEVAFRVPCPELVTGDFVASLQRALLARDYYAGPITGQPDSATRDAVRAFQRDTGFDSPVLTLETAQRLGLAPREFTQ